jgi:RNA polymerase sigma-70 factor (ECF subfamily)
MSDDTQSAPSSDTSAASFEELYERNVGAIYHFIYSKVGNREEAEDLTSQVFIKAVRGLDQARAGQSIQAWLFQVARTTVADHWREFYRLRAESLEKLLDAGWEASRAEPEATPNTAADGHVRAVLNCLPPRYRDVLTNRFLLNLSIRETSAKMGLTEANVKVLQYRALQKAAALDLRELDAVGCDASDPQSTR